MGIDLNDDLEGGLSDDSLDDADVNDHDDDVLDDDPKFLAGDVEALELEMERLVDERSAGLSTASSNGAQQIDS